MVFESLKQPVINGYLVAGAIVGPGGLQLIKELVQVRASSGPHCWCNQPADTPCNGQSCQPGPYANRPKGLAHGCIGVFLAQHANSLVAVTY